MMVPPRLEVVVAPTLILTFEGSSQHLGLGLSLTREELPRPLDARAPAESPDGRLAVNRSSR
jgi:hypothetical protein